MDYKNRFESNFTYYALRAEYLVALCACLYLLYINRQDVNWWVFIPMFAYIDLIGYIPGAIAYRRSATKQIPRIYYILYNSMHSLISGALVVALWIIFVGPEWALLAVPIHLSGDRSIFGNFLKPFYVSFEPEVHPAYAKFQKELAQ